MKKQGILNSHIAKVLADFGHTDLIVIGDVGLPIPDGVQKIDLALTPGFPSYEVTVSAVADDMVIEKIILAEEIKAMNEPVHQYMKEKFGDTPVEYISHEEFKTKTKQAKAVIRTGEITPYANCILQAGVFF
ncbi:D-ribose pyranase [Bacillus massiliigorillae]|uniref:D-ribose pyranase n=1 Tax=Bacillus massiliigorillae TaxID=1243664 RepID=UPI00039A099B|nr:D-ribose pyranase [Bacillus massiliigorillae]